MALIVGAGGALAAWDLIKLIVLTTNLVWFWRYDAASISLTYAARTPWLVGQVLPGQPGFWALLTMAATLGGTMRAPLTGAIFAVELTGDVRMLAALLAASASACAVTALLLKRSIPTEKIARRGQHITREYGIDPFEMMRVRDVMVSKADTAAAELSIPETAAILKSGMHQVYPVVDARNLVVGMVSRADALLWEMEGGHGQERLEDRVSDASLPLLHPDDVASHAVDLMLATDRGRLAVTDPTTTKLVGIVSRKDLLRVRAATSRKERERHAYFTANWLLKT